MDPREELTQELRKARTWILAVGILMFVVDMIMVYAVYGNMLPDSWKRTILLLDLGVLAYFIFMWWWAKSQPKLACILALVGFWALQIGVAMYSGDPTSIVKGPIIKILFTVALIKGIQSGTRASELQAQLGKVFE